MEIRIHINDRAVSFVGGIFKRRVVLVGLLLAALTTGAYALETFTTGTPISSSAVNGNFAELEARIAELEARPPSITGHRVVEEVFNIEPEYFARYTITCPAGKVALGSGWSAPFGTRVTSDRPAFVEGTINLTHNAWQFQVSNDSVNPVSIAAYVICADGSH